MALVQCRECGKEVSTAAIACPNCGATTKVSAGVRRILIIAAVVTAIAVAAPLVLRSVSSSTPEPIEASALPAPQAIDRHSNLYVWKMARELVARALKSPSSAVYAPLDQWTFDKIDDNSTRVKAWVESQNPFGVMMRDGFTAIVEVDTADLWRVTYLKFDNSDDAIGKLRRTPAEQKEVDDRKAMEARIKAANEETKKYNAELRRKKVEASKSTSRVSSDELRQQQMIDSEKRRQDQLEQAAINAKYNALRSALSRGEWRAWAFLGGRKASEAKIVGYSDGVFTLQKRDGDTIDARVGRMRKADQEYVREWARKAQVELPD